MNFKKLEIFGFKSFADKLEIKFDNGITGIVGPNGCGKSNVADSIRWVLGEQSAKILRGSQMMDVIFNGTEKRKSLSFCEVSLHFDNTSKIFPVDYNEIVITRKLYRSGESEYSLNKNICRLKDVVDLLRDCGVGREGYSIIGQGRIDEVLSAKPEERRSIFEEASGISKFKARRTETERKLIRTHDNLSRLNDILTEIDRQLKPLSSQAESAKIYLELKEQLKKHEINNYICQYESINSTKKSIETRLAGICDEYNLRQKEYGKASSDYDSLFVSLHNIDKEINSLRNNQLSITVGIEKQTGELNLFNERINLLTELNIRIKNDIQLNTEQKEKLNISLAKLSESKNIKQQEYEKLLLQSDELSTKFLEIVSRITKGEDEVEDNQHKVIDSLSRLSDIKSNLSSLLTEKNVLSDKQSEILKKTISLNTIIESDRLGKEQLISEQSSLKKKKQENTALKIKTVEDYNNAVNQQKETDRQINAYDSNLSSLKTKLNYLKQVKENFDGYNQSVKSLLAAAKNSNVIADKIEGAVARLMTVPEKYETAIDVALGNALQNIVTKTQDDAKYLINFLKDNRLGRVTFLPMDVIKARDIDIQTENIAEKTSGYIGLATKLISYDDKYYNIFSGLLGKTFVCNNLDNAIILSRKINFSIKIVTLEGEIIQPFGAMTGGSRKSEITNLLGYDREINDTFEKIDDTEKQIKSYKEKTVLYENVSQKLYGSIEEINQKIHDIDVNLATCEEKLYKKQSETANKENELYQLKADNTKVETRIQWIIAELKTADELESKINRQRNNADDVRVEQKEKYDNLRKQRDKLLEQTINIKVALAALFTEITGFDNNYLSIKQQIDEINKNIKNSNSLAETNLSNIDQTKINKNTVNFDNTSEIELTKIKDNLNNLDQYKYDMQKDLSESDKLRTELSLNIQRISENRIREENLLGKVDTDLENMKDRIWEEYQITYDSALVYREQDYDFLSSNTEINKLKKLINNLGYVNVNAIEDYRILKERFDDLDKQIKDLTKAEDDLKKIIAELTVEMVSRFSKGFNDINANFTRVFKELFGGGNAKLILDTEQTEDPLSAGIEIVAEPPGKKLQSISLLSGGERALTAIAILFAILRLRPMPFCVLDEIEAALDDANAMRFAKYLKNFSKDTQFIVITHRKPTMELADSLYGVTMQEKGVSKIVSVKLNEALSTAAEPA